MAPPAMPPVMRFGMVMMAGQITIRVRMVNRRANLTRAPSRWRETEAETCQPAGEITGAIISRPDHMDLMLSGDRMVRAQLGSDCRAIGYYTTVYLVPGEDGQICAGRDTILSRAGTACAIDGFRTLVPISRRTDR